MSYDPTDTELVVFLAAAGGCSLATKPGNQDNWIERTGPGGRGGSLPNYICKIARGVMRSGMSRSQAIAIAVSRAKAWASGGSTNSRGGAEVHADTRAKAAKAVAQWEALKAKSKAKQVVKASHLDGSPYLCLSMITSEEYDTDIVRQAWEQVMRKARETWRERTGTPTEGSDSPMATVSPYSEMPYAYIRSLWNSFIVVSVDGPDPTLMKIPYTVTDGEVTFGQPEKVVQTYSPAPSEDENSPEDAAEDAAEDAEDAALISALFGDDDDEPWDAPLTENETLLLGLAAPAMPMGKKPMMGKKDMPKGDASDEATDSKPDAAEDEAGASEAGESEIKDAASVRAAIKAVDSAKDPAAEKARIKKAAQGLHLSFLIPKGW